MILVSVVGDFHSSILPVFYNFHTQITKHILVYDDAKEDVRNSQNIKNGIENFIKKKSLSIEQLDYQLDEDSLDSLKKCADFLLSQTNNPKELYVNTTDGYSTLDTILNFSLYSYGTNFIGYDRYDNEYNLLNKEKLTKCKILYNLNIENHFLLKGYKVNLRGDKKFALENEQLIRELFEKHGESFNSFTQLSDKLYTIVDDLPENLEVKNSFIQMGFGSLHIKNSLLTGGLFEYYVYLLLKDMDFDDIAVGVEIYRNYKQSEIKNEFDVLVMKNNHVHIIECKFRNQIKLEDLVYKYLALSSIVDEDGKKLILIKKDLPYTHDIEENKFKGLVNKRGKLDNLEIKGAIEKNPFQFQLFIKSFFGI